ncbi:MAG TPA: hypothetical protein VGI03_16725 [Verrucomicrobiae bacterium]|jgi:hypothetical protein
MNATYIAGRFRMPTHMSLVLRAHRARRPLVPWWGETLSSPDIPRRSTFIKSQNCQTNPNLIFAIQLATVSKSFAYDKKPAFVFNLPSKNEPICRFPFWLSVIVYWLFTPRFHRSAPAYLAIALVTADLTKSNPVKASPTQSNQIKVNQPKYNVCPNAKW